MSEAPTVPTQSSGSHDVAEPDAGKGSGTKGFDVEEYLPNRRDALYLAAGAAVGGVFGFGIFRRTSGGPATGPDRSDAVELTPKQAKDLLEAGNARYVAGGPIHPDQSPARRAVVADGQNPFAVVLSCADSRVAPEVLFDQGIGDLFTVRSAGQVVDRAVLGSLQYGVEHLATPLLVVLGHSGCGAVAATVDAVRAASTSSPTPAAGTDGAGQGAVAADAHAATAGTLAPSAVDDLVTAIRPAVVEAQAIGGEDDLLAVSVSINVERTVELLKADPVIGPASSRRAVKVIGALYDLGTGEVDWL